MKFELDPILLDEQAARGRTLIEKLETQWPVAFVVVLLTGDDVGALGSEPGTLRPRVRQNVIFELAFAIAKLTRERVCALYDEGSSMRRAYGSIPSRSGLFRASKVTPVVTAGQTYFIVVDGYGGSSGSLTLSVTPP